MMSDKLPVPEGTVLQGKYQVGRLLGRGGMGVVVAARHLLLDTDVALKFLLTTEPDVVERFSREARAAARIQSEHVGRVLDVGALPDGSPFMVMEYLAGEDLSRVLERGAISVTDAVDYLLQACEAIAEAHALGIVHRDLKPANLFLARRALGRSMVKVLDFGISRGGATASRLTLTGTGVLGSPQYMSPEQWMEARAVDARSDVWSLGVVLYEMIAGHRPFEGNSLAAIFTAIAHGAPPPLPASIPPALAEAVLRCLEKDQTRRFSDVPSLAVAIAGFGSAASQPLLERIVQIGGVKDAGLATTERGHVDGSPGASGRDAAAGAPARTARQSAEAAMPGLSAAAGGTMVMPQEWEGGAAVVAPAAAEVPAGSRAADGVRASAAAGRGRASVVEPSQMPKRPVRGAAPVAPRGGGPPLKAAVAILAAGAVAIVAVVVVRTRGGPAEGPPDAPSGTPSAAPVGPSRPPVTPPSGTTPAGQPPAAEVAPADVEHTSPPATSLSVVAPPAHAPPDPPGSDPPASSPPSPSAASPTEPPSARGGNRRLPARQTGAADAAGTGPPGAAHGRPKTPAHIPEAASTRGKPGTHWSAVCSRLLERQSLGEPLSKEDLALYLRECRR
jgi:eukaryotic-like serine/threonine-protein kinase